MQQVRWQLRAGIGTHEPPVHPSVEGEGKGDKVYVVGEHKGHTEAVQKKDGQDTAAD